MQDDTLGAYNIADLRAIAIFRDAIDRVMALLGCVSVAELNHDCLATPPATRANALKGDVLLRDGAKVAAEH